MRGKRTAGVASRGQGRDVHIQYRHLHIDQAQMKTPHTIPCFDIDIV